MSPTWVWWWVWLWMWWLWCGRDLSNDVPVQIAATLHLNVGPDHPGPAPVCRGPKKSTPEPVVSQLHHESFSWRDHRQGHHRTQAAAPRKKPSSSPYHFPCRRLVRRRGHHPEVRTTFVAVTCGNEHQAPNHGERKRKPAHMDVSAHQRAVPANPDVRCANYAVVERVTAMREKHCAS